MLSSDMKKQFFKQSNAQKMKKQLILRYVILLVIMVTIAAINTYAGNSIQPAKTTIQKPPRDTPYIAQVQIFRSNNLDTPYISFTIKPNLVYGQVNNLLRHQPGLFHIQITFLSKEGLVVDEDDYYIDNRNYLQLRLETL